MGKKKDAMKKLEKDIKKLGDALCSVPHEDRAELDKSLRAFEKELKDLDLSSNKERKIRSLFLKEFERAGIKENTPRPPSSLDNEPPKSTTPPSTTIVTPQEKPAQIAQNKNPLPKEEPWTLSSVWKKAVEIGRGLSWVQHPVISAAKEFSADLAEKFAKEALGCQDESVLKRVKATAKVTIGLIGHKITLNPIAAANEIVQFFDNLQDTIDSVRPDSGDYFENVDPAHPIKGMREGNEAYKTDLCAFNDKRNAAIQGGKEIARKGVATAEIAGDAKKGMSSKQSPEHPEKERESKCSWRPDDPLLL